MPRNTTQLNKTHFAVWCWERERSNYMELVYTQLNILLCVMALLKTKCKQRRLEQSCCKCIYSYIYFALHVVTPVYCFHNRVIYLSIPFPSIYNCLTGYLYIQQISFTLRCISKWAPMKYEHQFSTSFTNANDSNTCIISLVMLNTFGTSFILHAFRPLLSILVTRSSSSHFLVIFIILIKNDYILYVPFPRSALPWFIKYYYYSYLCFIITILHWFFLLFYSFSVT